MAVLRLSRPHRLGIACALGLGTMPGPARAAPPSVLTLDCAVSGGGYAIRSPAGAILENGDGAPFAPPPHATLRITAAPPGVRVTHGALPHPDCRHGPVLDSLEPLRFHWCEARYEITPGAADAYTLRSSSSAALTTGPQQGNVMEAFMVGRCTAADPLRSR